MKFIEAADFTVSRPWGALGVVTMTGATSVRLHWGDQPYKWHVNDGEEVSVVIDEVVDAHYCDAGQECVRTLTPDTICFAEAGDEHIVYPQGEARMLVIEKKAQSSPQ